MTVLHINSSSVNLLLFREARAERAVAEGRDTAGDGVPGPPKLHHPQPAEGDGADQGGPALRVLLLSVKQQHIKSYHQHHTPWYEL